MTGPERLVEEHKRLSNEWLDAERFRVDMLESLIKEHGGKCTMD